MWLHIMIKELHAADIAEIFGEISVRGSKISLFTYWWRESGRYHDWKLGYRWMYQGNAETSRRCGWAIFGIPLVLHRFKIDPALATGPFITTINDIMGISIYLGIGKVFYTLL